MMNFTLLSACNKFIIIKLFMILVVQYSFYATFYGFCWFNLCFIVRFLDVIINFIPISCFNCFWWTFLLIAWSLWHWFSGHMSWKKSWAAMSVSKCYYSSFISPSFKRTINIKRNLVHFWFISILCFFLIILCTV